MEVSSGLDGCRRAGTVHFGMEMALAEAEFRCIEI